jgi:3-phenylpropionate/cinnamic acid dioxygenase small subunit
VTASKVGGWTLILEAEPQPALPAMSSETGVVTDWLLEEADQLDQGRYTDWVARLAPEIVYRAPVRTTASGERAESLSSSMDIFYDDRYTLGKRIERLGTEHAWAEDPPSRTRRFVTNIRSFSGAPADHLIARSNLLVYLTRGDSPPELISAVRRDVFRRTDAALLLAERTIAIDATVIWSESLTSLL